MSTSRLHSLTVSPLGRTTESKLLDSRIASHTASKFHGSKLVSLGNRVVLNDLLEMRVGWMCLVWHSYFAIGPCGGAVTSPLWWSDFASAEHLVETSIVNGRGYKMSWPSIQMPLAGAVCDSCPHGILTYSPTDRFIFQAEALLRSFFLETS
ncbi:hypothetical protein K440DRAFT_6310 [Wilcoxina mikolae CBS 423.85]|nr:hypothetical protein K440DRAFT_6310 [Wilcoxina mikolae CBS 423.85]